MKEEGHALFWNVAAEWLSKPEVSKSTMMGFPCLRLDGQFFASVHREQGSLIVKVPASRVQELVNSEQGVSFAPAGRVFREWVAIPVSNSDTWPERMAEAYAFVGSKGSAK